MPQSYPKLSMSCVKTQICGIHCPAPDNHWQKPSTTGISSPKLIKTFMKVVSFFSYKSLRGFIDGYLAAHFPVVSKLLNRHKPGVKYLFAGGTAAAVNLMLLYVLTDIIGVWYLTSSVVAFIASFITSFVLQKFWTFRDPGLGRIKKQFAIYIVLGAINFFSGPALLYVFVDVFHIC